MTQAVTVTRTMTWTAYTSRPAPTGRVARAAAKAPETDFLDSGAEDVTEEYEELSERLERRGVEGQKVGKVGAKRIIARASNTGNDDGIVVPNTSVHSLEKRATWPKCPGGQMISAPDPKSMNVCCLSGKAAVWAVKASKTVTIQKWFHVTKTTTQRVWTTKVKPILQVVKGQLYGGLQTKEGYTPLTIVPPNTPCCSRRKQERSI